MVVKLKGRLDASTMQAFKDEFSGLMGDPPARLVVDLKDVSFIDSSGLGSLISVLRSVRRTGGDLKLVDLPERIQAVFELTRLHKVFEICPDVETALGRHGDA